VSLLEALPSNAQSSCDIDACQRRQEPLNMEDEESTSLRTVARQRLVKTEKA
jgi:hypothetical protein